MPEIVIVGDGPAGLSAALLLAQRDYDVTIVGQNKTGAHSAMLYNYPAIAEITGPDFIARTREQVAAMGARVIEAEVTGIEKTGDRFVASDDQGGRHESDYLIYAAGRSWDLARELGVAANEDGSLQVDRDGRTNIERFYAVGRATRPAKIQVAISVGDGAAAAVDIISEQVGKDTHNWDTLPKS